MNIWLMASFTKAMVGPGFVFDGINDWVEIPNSSSLHPTRVTVDAWVYMTGNENRSRRVIGKDNVAVSREYSLGVNDHSRVEGFVVVPSGLKVVTGVTNTQINVWYHIAMTYNGMKLRLYVNGVQEAVADVTGDIVPTLSTVGIGADAFGEFTKGIIDDAQIFSRALTGAEILAIYQAGAAGQCKPEIFVSSITPSYEVVGRGFLISTSIVIQDENGVGIENASAQIKTILPSGSVLDFPVTTDATGRATVSFGNRDAGLYKFAVRKVSHPIRDYDRSLNIETSDTLLIP